MKENTKKNITAWLFMLPYLVFFLGFLMFPILRGFYLSFFNARIGRMGDFIGLQNFVNILRDSSFWESLFNTLFFVVISTPTIAIMGFILALIVNSKLKGTTFFRSAYFVSYVLSMAVVTGLWKFILQPYTGLLSSFTTAMGMGEIFMLSTRWLAWVSVLITTLWWTVGFVMVLFLAGLQDIPEELYEAARIDGASSSQILFQITIPMLRGVMIMIFMLQSIQSFKLFGQTWLMTLGGPGTHTRTIVHYIYQTGFIERQMGRASAMSILFLIVVLVFTLTQGKLTSIGRNRGGE